MVSKPENYKPVTDAQIQHLVDNGYTHAAFGVKKNADRFIAAWRKRGYVLRERFRSAGAIIEKLKPGRRHPAGPGEYIIMGKSKAKR